MPGSGRSGPQAFAKVAIGVASMRSMRARVLPLAMILPVLKSPGQMPDAEGLEKNQRSGIAGITESVIGWKVLILYVFNSKQFRYYKGYRLIMLEKCES